MNDTRDRPQLHLDAVIFDMDGVVTNTARLHAAAWKQLFDDYLQRRAQQRQEPFVPFDIQTDYLSYVDGKPRYEGVKSFITSRGIELPYGERADEQGTETVCGLGNSKDEMFERLLHSNGPDVFKSTVTLIKSLRSHGIKVGIVTSSRHCQDVLQLAGIEELFEARVDGVIADSLGLKGKPNPDIFVKAAELLGVRVEHSVVVEDAMSGVQAGRDGRFGLVIGVDRGGNREALAAHGADIVVSDLAELSLEEIDAWFKATLPSALTHGEDIRRRLENRQLAVFLDYDGTLTPIVARPELAVLSDGMRETVRTLGRCCTTAIVSGRGLADVAKLVGLEELYYAGNHGFEIMGPDGADITYEPGKKFLSAVNAISRRIEESIAGIDGAFVENKSYSLSVHYRLATPDRVPEIERAIDEALESFPNLHKRPGKKVFEVRPKMDWDKGKAVLWLLEALDMDRADVLPIYVGDDVTDEDAFAALRGRGIGVVVIDTRGPSAAEYSLRNTDEVQQFLQSLAALVCASES
ncbi:MAG: trehalose-phosphatase [Acidiferrobacterales bacterium]